MSGPNEVPVPSEHPNDDLLADLAAEVLPDDLAGHVQEHVVVCALCAGLLAEAESVRAMLLQVESEQMPDEILVRLEQALLTARRQDEAGGPATDLGETRILNRTAGVEPGRADAGRRIARSGPSAPASGRAAAAGPMTTRLNRMSAPAQSARRQAIEEQKADRPSRFSRISPAFRIAAAVLVVVGAGAGALQLRGSGSGADSGTIAASSGEAPVVAAIQSTKTDYTKGALPRQVKTLVANSQKLLAAPATEAPAQTEQSLTAADPTSTAATSKAAGTSVPEAATVAESPAATQGQSLRSPGALQNCLTAIGAGQVQPVAVDLARYAGREAAIIVLPADGGGYDVWVVARDCRADSDGALDVVHVAS